MEENSGNLNGRKVELARRRTYHVPPGNLFEQVWPSVEPWLAEAMKHARQHMMTTDDLADGCRSGEFALLLMRSESDKIAAAAVISRGFRPFDHEPYIALMACGGSLMEEWLPDLVGDMKAIGRSAGASEIMILGRPSWRKVLAPYGGREVATMVSVSTGGENG